MDPFGRNPDPPIDPAKLARLVVALESRLSRVEAEVASLREAMTRQPAPGAPDSSAAGRRPVEAPSGKPQATAGPSSTADDERNVSELAAAPAVAAMLKGYAAAAGGSKQALDVFVETYDPVTVTVDAGGTTLSPAGAAGHDMLWFVPAAGSPTYGVLLPGAYAIRNWDKYFQALGGDRARTEFGALYDVTSVDRLSVRQPAWAKRPSAGRFTLVRRGVL